MGKSTRSRGSRERSKNTLAVAAVEPLVSLLPSAALGQGLRDVLLDGQGLPLHSVLVLVGWAAIGSVLTARTFRWS